MSYHNLANLFQHKNHFQLAFQELDEVDAYLVRYLVRYLESEVTSLKVMDAVRRGIDKKRAELLSFMQTNRITTTRENFVGGSTFNH